MKLNQELKADIEKYKSYVIIVEGKKDVAALNSLGFEKVYPIHLISIPIKERVEQIMLEAGRKAKICILTDFDRRGKQLYFTLKPMFQELGARLDSSLRGLLLKARLSHIEGMHKFIEKLGNSQC